MSALTDLFTALANKIRTKTGGSDTYTPPQMVNAIDDVYNAGVAAGTPTLTGDAAAADVKSGKTFYGNTLTKQTGTFAADTSNNTITAGTSAKTVNPDSGKYFASVTVNPTPTETKTQAAGTSNIDVEPTSGKHLSKVTITPQQHSQSFTPTANLVGASGNANDMGASHNNRYVNTSGMIIPSGNKAITANGTNIDVSSYATASVSVPNPTLSGDASASDVKSGKTFYNSDYTKRTGTFSADTTNNSVTATISAQTAYPASGKYFSSFTVNPQSHSDTATTYTSNGTKDLGTNHNIRYVPISVPKGSLCSSRTTLWSGSSSTFNSQTITLNSSMASYDYIVITAKVSSSSSATMEFYINVSNFRYNSTVSSTVTNAPALCMYVTGSTAYGYVRRCMYTSDTQINFSSAVRYTTSAASAQNSYLIPTKIEGLDYYVA